jgi:hypothetical protein
VYYLGHVLVIPPKATVGPKVYDFKTSSIFPKDNQNFFTVRLKSV